MSVYMQHVGQLDFLLFINIYYSYFIALTFNNFTLSKCASDFACQKIELNNRLSKLYGQVTTK